MGTWSVADTKQKRKKIEQAIEQLKELKKKLYPIFGDDSLFDHIDRTILRLQWGVKVGEAAEREKQ